MSRVRSWGAVLGLLLVTGGVLAADRVAPPVESEEESPTPVSGVEPTAGSAVCAVGDARDGTALTAVAARPPGLGSGPSETEVLAFEDGETRRSSLPTLFPGADGRTSPSGGQGLGTWARWRNAPVAVTREWAWTDAEDLPDALVAGPCAPPFSDTWTVPGMSTVGGEEARLRLANPYRTDATVAVRFLTPEGVEEPLILRNVSVPARSVREIEVNEVLPERADLAAVVEVATGRVAVEGYQLARAAIGDIDAASLLAAAPAPAEEWTVPYVVDGEDAASWLWVANPGERTATVELSLHGPDGGEVPAGLGEVTAPPGTLTRVDLRGTFPEDVPSAAVTARSGGVPVAVSAGFRLTGPDATNRTYTVQLGADTTDRSWVVSGGSPDGRLERLRLVNPGSEDATVDVGLFNGTVLDEPDDLQDLEVPAGSARTVALTDHLEGVRRWSAFVRSEGGRVVVGRVGRGGSESTSRFVAVLGVPGGRWTQPASSLVGRHEPGLVVRLDTDPDTGDGPPTAQGTAGP